VTAEQLELNRLQSALRDRYHLKRILGRGGMATVYLAEEPRHSRNLALKVLRPEFAATIGADRFLREIKTIAALTHPHILPLFDSGEADGQLFYVMPYVEGETLRSRIERERQLPIQDAVRIATEVADALSFAHGRGIVHRDIKPENILLEGKHAVVADFGIAKALTAVAGDSLTNLGFTLGTPQYMSPEQAAADPSLDGRSDLYSLGCVTFEMLSGTPPFAESSPHALFAQKLAETAPRVGATRQDIPQHLEDAIARALRRAPSERFDTMLQFADALSGTAVASPPRNASEKLRLAVAGKDLPRLPIEIRPLDAELDIYGLTHPGKIERVNQDHFVICSIRREMQFHYTSLPDDSRVPRKGERRGFIVIVADGMGRGKWGELASRNALETITQQLMHAVASYSIQTEQDEASFLNALYSMTTQCQTSGEQRSWENSAAQGSSFGLTMWIGIWPKAYVVEVGAGQIFQLAEGNLFPLSGLGGLSEASKTRAMQATGAVDVTPPVPPTQSFTPRHTPVIYRHPQKWNSIGLICTRGLTETVSESRIAEVLGETTSAKDGCEVLLEEALQNGGSQNLTIAIGRTMPRQDNP
jgi:serine/threonine protein kinase